MGDSLLNKLESSHIFEVDMSQKGKYLRDTRLFSTNKKSYMSNLTALLDLSLCDLKGK